MPDVDGGCGDEHCALELTLSLYIKANVGLLFG